MNLILKYLTAVIIFLVFACESSGGVWLGEGNNSGNPYNFGPNQDVEMLKNFDTTDNGSNLCRLLLLDSFSYKANRT